MDESEGLGVTFRIDEAAKQEISSLRTLFERETHIDADIIMIGWAEISLNYGANLEDVVVSFYSAAQREQMKKYMRVVGGLEVVLFTIPKYYEKFEGKVLSFAEGRFQLR